MEQVKFVIRASHQGSERQQMQVPEDVGIMVRLHAQGWGSRRIARELGVSRNTVKRYVRAGGYLPYGGAGGRAKSLDGLDSWLAAHLHQHRGNADVLRQELEREKNLRVSLRTIERAVMGERQRLAAEQVATVRFETPPGKQVQGDFGQITVRIGGEKVKLHACVLTLGYSRRPFVEVFDNEQIDSWLSTMEASFRHFDGIPEEMLVDNAKAIWPQAADTRFSPQEWIRAVCGSTAHPIAEMNRLALEHGVNAICFCRAPTLLFRPRVRAGRPSHKPASAAVPRRSSRLGTMHSIPGGLVLALKFFDAMLEPLDDVL